MFQRHLTFRCFAFFRVREKTRKQWNQKQTVYEIIIYKTFYKMIYVIVTTAVSRKFTK